MLNKIKIKAEGTSGVKWNNIGTIIDIVFKSVSWQTVFFDILQISRLIGNYFTYINKKLL